MGNSDSTETFSDGQINTISAEQLFNTQQNTFSNILLLDIRSKTNYQKSHIDLSHHLYFAEQLSSKHESLHKKWLQQIVKLHQSTYSKSKITFYIIHNNKQQNMENIVTVCKWLNKLYHDKIDNIQQIETSIFYKINYNKYKQLYPFMCTDYNLYEEGRLYPSQITPNIYLSNWGIASDGKIYKILSNIKYVINCTYDHPNIFNINDTEIYHKKFLDEVNKYEEKHNEQDPMIKRQNEKIDGLRMEFKNIRLKYIRVPIVDNEENDAYKYFKNCCEFIEKAIENGGEVLIHCRHGQSRSVTITAAWLIYKNKMNVEDVLKYIKNKRPRINPNKGFVEQLYKWYNDCNKI